MPVEKLSSTQPVSDGMGGFYPPGRTGCALKGQEIYRSLGCYYCHTRIVKPYEYGSDFERGWGVRRLVARDFLSDSLVVCGSVRLAPDLANIGTRKPHKFAVPWRYTSTNQVDQIREMERRLLLIIYEPKLFNPKSIMPSFKQLFYIMSELNKSHEPSHLVSLAFNPQIDVNGQTIVPSENAMNLVEYLKSLKSEYPLFEAPPPPDLSRFIRRAGEITNVLQSTIP